MLKGLLTGLSASMSFCTISPSGRKGLPHGKRATRLELGVEKQHCRRVSMEFPKNFSEALGCEKPMFQEKMLILAPETGPGF